jgi:competence protein ComEC
MHRVRPKAGVAVSNSFLFRGKQILLIDRPVRFKPAQVKPVVHLLVLARNPKIDITLLAETFSIRQVVIDGSVPPWKAKLLKKACDSLRILCYDVAEKGAFVMKL